MNLRFFPWTLLLTWPVLVLHAVQMDPLSIEQLAAQSSVILRGTVLAKTCQLDPAGRIYTKVELDVHEVWKGLAPTNRFIVVHGGGILGERKTVVSGQVEYGIGEEVVAFLVLNHRGEGVTLGLAQGKFHVWKDPQTGEHLTGNLFHGNADTPRLNPQADGATTSRRLPLQELKRRVQGGPQ